MQGPGRPDIVMQGPGRPDLVNAGSRETRFSECRVQGDQDIVNAGSGRPYSDIGSRETRYSECRVRGTGYSECLQGDHSECRGPDA
ncbi:unnamed protein product [Staurois parvus]|uniref:Pectinesterase n=1 Tax=Staurois parvus TaxID=386267 RepID=A0ABN9BSE4_9NEOB|nr:unnamed protein product [Staurois parvus]